MRVILYLGLLLGFAVPSQGEPHEAPQVGRSETTPTYFPSITDADLSSRSWEKPANLDVEFQERLYLSYNFLERHPPTDLSPAATLASLDFQGRLLEMGVDSALANTMGRSFEAALRDRSKLNSGERFDEQVSDMVSLGSTLLNPKATLKDIKILGKEFNRLNDAGDRQLALDVFERVMGFNSAQLDGPAVPTVNMDRLKNILERAAKNSAVQKGLDSAFIKVMGVGQTERLLMVRSHDGYGPIVEKWAEHYAPRFKDMTPQKAVAAARHSVSPQAMKEISEKTKALTEAFRQQSAQMDAEALRVAKEKLRKEIHEAFSEARAGSNLFSLVAGQIDPQAGKAYTAVSRATVDIAETLTLAQAGDIPDIKAAFDIASIVTNLLSSILGGPSPEAMILEQLAELRREVRSMHQDMLKEFNGVHLHLYALERHLDNRFSDLDQLIRSTNSALATVEGKLDLHHAEVKRAFGDQRAGELDTLMRECPNRSSQIPMDATYYASCLDKLMACAVTKSRDSISTGSKLLFDGKTPDQVGVLEEADSVLGYADNWSRLNFLAGAAAYFGNPLSTKALPNPPLWAMCASGYLQLASLRPDYYRRYDPDLSHLKELRAAGDDLDEALSAITTGAKGKADAFLLKEMLTQYRASVNGLHAHVDTVRSKHETDNLAGYDLRLDARQKPRKPIPFDIEEGKPAIKPCAGSWAASSELPSLLGGDPASAFQQFIPSSVRIADDIFSKAGGVTQLKFCYDITEFEFDERHYDTPGTPGGSYQPFVKSYQLTVRATYQGNPVFARALSAPIDLPSIDSPKVGLSAFLDQLAIEHFKANLRTEWTKEGGFLGRFIRDSRDSHFSTGYAYQSNQDKPAPIPHGLTFRLQREREMSKKWNLDLLGPTIDASIAGNKTRVNAAKSVHDAFEAGRLIIEKQIQDEIREGKSKEVKKISGARALLASFLQLGLPTAIKENEEDLSTLLNNLPSGQGIQAQAALKPFIWNEVDRLIFDPNNPTYPKPAPEDFLRPKPKPSFGPLFDSIGLTKFVEPLIEQANQPAKPPKEALTLDKYGMAPGDPAAPSLTDAAYAAYYKPGVNELVTSLHSRVAELEKALDQVLAEEAPKLNKYRQHAIVQDWRAELLKAETALKDGRPYKASKKPN